MESPTRRRIWEIEIILQHWRCDQKWGLHVDSSSDAQYLPPPPTKSKTSKASRQASAGQHSCQSKGTQSHQAMNRIQVVVPFPQHECWTYGLYSLRSCPREQESWHHFPFNCVTTIASETTFTATECTVTVGVRTRVTYAQHNAAMSPCRAMRMFLRSKTWWDSGPIIIYPHAEYTAAIITPMAQNTFLWKSIYSQRRQNSADEYCGRADKKCLTLALSIPPQLQRAIQTSSCCLRRRAAQHRHPFFEGAGGQNIPQECHTTTHRWGWNPKLMVENIWTQGYWPTNVNLSTFLIRIMNSYINHVGTNNYELMS